LKSEIAQFRQQDFELLYEAWERFKDFLRRCLQHGYEDWHGTLMSKAANEAHILLEKMATNSYQWPSERSSIKRVVGVLEVDSFTQLVVQVSTLSNQITAWTSNGVSQRMDSMASTSTLFMETKGNEQVNFVNNHNFNSMGNQLPTHYHPRLRNHENFFHANNQNMLQPPPGYNNPPHPNPQVGEKKASLEDLISTFIGETRARLNKDKAKIDNIETQLGHLASNALEQMANYAKFMKNVMSRKRRLVEFEIVNLTEECSAILQKKLPQKLKDQGSFTISCTIGGSFFDKALCDLEVSINLIPLSLSTITLQLADRSLTYPRGVVEDVLVKVDNFLQILWC
ncbi:hypothetical protein Pfo_018248, partial [Paulownia fortunei]